MKFINKNYVDNRVAILCEHIANEGYPILRARKDEPLENVDSGWQFICNSGKIENEEKAQVWSITEVLEIEPSFVGYLDESPGTVLVRESIKHKWKVLKDN
jgi:hypothetical protein